MSNAFLRRESSGVMSVRIAVSVLAVLMGTLLLAAPIFAQTANGRISGSVKDQTGGAIVGAAVVVTDTARGLARNLTSDDAGAYLAPNLLPGNYTVRATFTGFQAWERTNIVLGVGGDVFVDVTLVPGAQTQTVTITEELPLVNTTSSVLGGALSSETILDLPLGSRNFKNLLDLRPGTVTNLGNDSGGGGAQSVNGLRNESSNEFLVEGLHGMDPFTGQSIIGNLALRGDGATVLPPDAIQEFNQQFNAKAEYGMKAGASVNVGIKSGTNSLHGTAYSFFRDVATDARDFYNDAATQRKVNGALQQFGGTVGGPIKKDKLFFFMAFEQQDYTQGSASSATVPFTDAALIANFPACIATSNCAGVANSIAGTRTPDDTNHLILACLGVQPANRSPQSLALVGLDSSCSPGSTYPNATSGAAWFVPHGAADHGANNATNTSISTYFPNTQIKNTSIGGLAKVDYTLNDKNTINGFLFTGYGNNEGETTKANPIWGNRAFQKPYMIAGTWTWLPNSSWANSLRVGKSRIRGYYRGLDVLQGQTAAQLGLTTGVATIDSLVGPGENLGYPQSFTVQGYSAFGSRNTETRKGESLEISDAVSYLRGQHSVRFGGTLMTNFQNGGTWANTRGTLAFGLGDSGSDLGNGLLAFFSGQNPITDNTSANGAIGYCPANAVGTTSTCVGQPTIRTTTTGLETASLFYGNPESHIRRMNYALYLQDDWRVRPRVTLNLGLRYDIVSVPHDKDYILGGFDPQLGLVQEGVQLPSVHNPDHNNFGPRIGVAWDMFGNGKTVLRAGGSMVFELTPLQIYAEVGNAPGLAGTPTAWIKGCTVGANTFDTDVAAGVQTIPATATTNCGTASGGTYADPTTKQNLTSAVGFTFTPATLTTSGGTRNVGQVGWARSDNNIVGVVSWDGPLAGTTSAVFPGSALLNCEPSIRLRDGATGTATNGRVGGGCAVVTADRHLTTPYIQTWTLSLQHAIVNNVVLEAAYVGNHGTKLIGRTDDNQAPIGSGWNAAALAACIPTASAANCNGTSGTSDTATNNARPFIAKFPFLTTITRVSNLDTSNYDALQMTLTARNFHGASFTSGYTYAKALDVNSSSTGAVGTDSYNVNLDYGRANSDLRHRFTFSSTYQVPGMKGYAGLLQGWKLNGIFRYQTGRPWAAGANGDFMGTNRTTRWDFTGDPTDFSVDYHGVLANQAVFHPGGTAVPTGTNPRTGVAYVASDLAINTPLCTTDAHSQTTLQVLGCWTQGGSAITPPQVNSFGNMAKGIFDGPKYWSMDFSVTKRQQITERFSAEFRAETFNTFNHPAIGQPGTTVSSCTTSSCSFGQPSNTPAVAATNSFLGTGGPRRMQFGVKIIF